MLLPQAVSIPGGLGADNPFKGLLHPVQSFCNEASAGRNIERITAVALPRLSF
jgi:hypothetical protein